MNIPATSLHSFDSTHLL